MTKTHLKDEIVAPADRLTPPQRATSILKHRDLPKNPAELHWER
jgi:hypothetical protein